MKMCGLRVPPVQIWLQTQVNGELHDQYDEQVLLRSNGVGGTGRSLGGGGGAPRACVGGGGTGRSVFVLSEKHLNDLRLLLTMWHRGWHDLISGLS